MISAGIPSALPSGQEDKDALNFLASTVNPTTLEIPGPFL